MSTGYQWDAEEYARSSAAQQGWGLELVDKLALRGDEAVLDIGCGDGRITAEIARRVPRGSVVGIDNSPEMIERARDAWPAARHPGLTFELADAQALSFAARFEVAFSSAALHWVRDHRAVLRGVARALRPGGRILFQMGGRGNGAAVFAAALQLTAAPAWRAWFEGFEFPWSFPDPEEYAGWCAEAGLRARRVELVPKTMRQAGVEGLAAWIRTTWMPYTERVPAERREAFIAEAAARYAAAHPPDAEGMLSIAMVRLEIEADRAQERPDGGVGARP
jgi:trans-aconitate methyltransferase